MSEYEQAAKPQPDEPPGPPLPRIGESTDLSFPDASGRTWSERDFRGKVVIAVLWSARCGPCVRELPEVQRLFERHRRDPSTLVVTLDLDDDPALPAVKDFLKGHDFTFPVLRAPVLLGRTGIPRTWIIDRRGILREDLRGAGPGLATGHGALDRGVGVPEADDQPHSRCAGAKQPASGPASLN